MEITTAIARQVGELQLPIITSYQLAQIICGLYKTKKFDGEKLQHVKKTYPMRSDYSRTVRKLMTSGVLSNTKAISSNEVFSVIGKGLAAGEEIICAVNQFCYISHLSAMSYHGLTNRFPKIIFITEPIPKLWSSLANERMKKDLGTDFGLYKQHFLPNLRRIKLSSVNRKTINSFSTKNFDAGAYISEQKKVLRISTVGRTFLDMVRNPNLCGGIYHVLETYQQHATRYSQLIIDEAEQHGTIIDKVRLGYILEERLGIGDKKIDQWKKLAQRGGSRKLVADYPYIPEFSETWALSINVENTKE